ncbi:MAG: methylated-DNA--[protein]-cysteine S-methyltransferase [Prevotella sp.]|jgi:O-6-methylguanine DNA methyltransferase|nr:methylated-DNA--[protein]-cysteine S-methyltransferase [Prevotella sp.]
MMNIAYCHSPVGLLKIEEEDENIVALRIVSSQEKAAENTSPLLEEAKKQLSEYFSGKRFNFDLPLKQSGTPFQQKAWNYLATIPYGKTVSYKNEAEATGSPKSCRAIGSANGKNNIAIIVPCHRVVNTGGKLGGYAYGLDVKRKLLELEKQYAEENRAR